LKEACLEHLFTGCQCDLADAGSVDDIDLIHVLDRAETMELELTFHQVQPGFLEELTRGALSRSFFAREILSESPRSRVGAPELALSTADYQLEAHSTPLLCAKVACFCDNSSCALILGARCVWTAVLEALRARLAVQGGPLLSLFTLDQIPLFNLEGECLPAPVQALKEAISASDGIVICSPEYNHGMSDVLKNALDWASRPHPDSPLKGKPALIMTAAPSLTGGARAGQQIREALASCFARVVARPDVVIRQVQDKIVGGRFVDEAVLSLATQAIRDLVAEIKLLRQSTACATAELGKSQ
jgi:chromate reductase